MENTTHTTQEKHSRHANTYGMPAEGSYQEPVVEERVELDSAGLTRLLTTTCPSCISLAGCRIRARILDPKYNERDHPSLVQQENGSVTCEGYKSHQQPAGKSKIEYDMFD